MSSKDDEKLRKEIKKQLKLVKEFIKEMEKIQPATWHPLCPYPVLPKGTKKKTRKIKSEDKK